MTVWSVIIISGLMTNIHDPLMVVVPCLSAGPCGLVSGLFQSVQLTTVNLNTNPKCNHAHDDGDVSSLFGAQPPVLVMKLAPVR